MAFQIMFAQKLDDYIISRIARERSLSEDKVKVILTYNVMTVAMAATVLGLKDNSIRLNNNLKKVKLFGKTFVVMNDEFLKLLLTKVEYVLHINK